MLGQLTSYLNFPVIWWSHRISLIEPPIAIILSWIFDITPEGSLQMHLLILRYPGSGH